MIGDVFGQPTYLYSSCQLLVVCLHSVHRRKDVFTGDKHTCTERAVHGRSLN